MCNHSQTNGYILTIQESVYVPLYSSKHRDIYCVLTFEKIYVLQLTSLQALNRRYFFNIEINIGSRQIGLSYKSESLKDRSLCESNKLANIYFKFQLYNQFRFPNVYPVPVFSCKLLFYKPFQWAMMATPSSKLSASTKNGANHRLIQS